MRKYLREAGEFLNECYPIIIIVTWLLLVVVIVKLLISGAIR